MRKIKFYSAEKKKVYEYHRKRYEIECPILMEYAGRKWPVQQAYLDELHRQAAAAHAIGMISPVQLFKLAADALCRTDARAHDSFMEAVRRYREAILGYFNEKQVYGSYLWFTAVDPAAFMSADEIVEYMTAGRCRTPSTWDGSYVRLMPAWNEPGPFIDVSDAPRFDWRTDTLRASMAKSIGNLGGMTLGVLLLFFLWFVSFTRFDVR